MPKAPALINLTPEQRALIRQASGNDLAALDVEQVASGWLFQAEGEKLWLLKPARSELSRSTRRKPRPRINSRLARFQLKVGKSRIHGWGVFAVEPIPSGCDVIEYVGEIVTPRELCRRVKNAGETHAIELDQMRTIDGSVGGSGAEIINHSCSPNMRYRRSRDHVFVRSIRSIEPGEELTADYRFRSEVPKVPCRCGSPNCRGTINTV
jgi:SET domain-containing protein